MMGLALIKPHSDKFSVLDLKIQSINVKFHKLLPILKDLLDANFECSAICLQETWLQGGPPDLSHFNIPNYTPIASGTTCSSHGGLVIYLHNAYDFSIKSIIPPLRFGKVNS